MKESAKKRPASRGGRPAKNPKFPRAPRVLHLATITEARETLALFIKAHDRDELSENQYRAHVYALRGLLDYLQAERELEIERRLAEIERRLDDAATAAPRAIHRNGISCEHDGIGPTNKAEPLDPLPAG